LATTIQTSGIDEQAKYLAQNIPNLTEGQAKLLLEQAFQRGSSVVIGGSRVRGDYTPISDLDVGFGNLTRSQAKRVISRVSKAGPLQLERMPIVPGFQSTSVPQIQTPEEFFQRSGIRGPTDPKAGQAFAPSGSITAKPDGAIVVIPPGAMP
jgi:hypothetical protein